MLAVLAHALVDHTPSPLSDVGVRLAVLSVRCLQPSSGYGKPYPYMVLIVGSGRQRFEQLPAWLSERRSLPRQPGLCTACCQPFLLRSHPADGPGLGRYIAEYLEGDDQA